MDPISNDEFILRHIPGGTSWQVPPDGRIASTNFRFRPGETGISLSRVAVTSAEKMMSRLGTPETGSRIAVARVGDLRELGFDVIAVPIPEDLGHAEIRPTTNTIVTKAMQRTLAALFQYVEQSNSGSS